MTEEIYPEPTCAVQRTPGAGTDPLPQVPGP